MQHPSLACLRSNLSWFPASILPSTLVTPSVSRSMKTLCVFSSFGSSIPLTKRALHDEISTSTDSKRGHFIHFDMSTGWLDCTGCSIRSNQERQHLRLLGVVVFIISANYIFRLGTALAKTLNETTFDQSKGLAGQPRWGPPNHKTQGRDHQKLNYRNISSVWKWRLFQHGDCRRGTKQFWDFLD